MTYCLVASEHVYSCSLHIVWFGHENSNKHSNPVRRSVFCSAAVVLMQGELGDVVYVELPGEGDKFSRGEAFGVVESVKTASDVYAPVSGEIVAFNQAATEDPKKACPPRLSDTQLLCISVRVTSVPMMQASGSEMVSQFRHIRLSLCTTF